MQGVYIVPTPVRILFNFSVAGQVLEMLTTRNTAMKSISRKENVMQKLYDLPDLLQLTFLLPVAHLVEWLSVVLHSRVAL